LQPITTEFIPKGNWRRSAAYSEKGTSHLVIKMRLMANRNICAIVSGEKMCMRVKAKLLE